MRNSCTAEVLIPRSLCLIEDLDNLNIDVEDLCSVSITWEDGVVSELKPLKNKVTKPKNILFPRFVETHSHLINLLHGQIFLIWNQIMRVHYQ